MSQDNYFNQNNFQPPPFNTNGLYQPDMTMQFAPSVPSRQLSQRTQEQQQHLPLSYPSFQNQGALMSNQQCKYQSSL